MTDQRRGIGAGLGVQPVWRRPSRSVRQGGRPSICFLFNAQLHQLLHGITTAAELARRGDVEVHVVVASRGNLDYARRVVERMGGAPILFRLAGPEILRRIAELTGRSVPPKLLTLAAIAPSLRHFDAIALPERTSINLKWFGVRRPRYVHVDHGAGDREVGMDPRIAKFDFVLTAGEKQRERFFRAGLIRPGAHAMVGYPKFDAADVARDLAWRPFADDRPIVLYNPHFSSLGSWQRCGMEIVEAFAAQDRYNFILAPHVRMFDCAYRRERAEAALAEIAALPHVHVDLGSDHSVEMSYTSMADVYIGDVSSQVYEFIRQPRPCLFVNANHVDWRADENYGHWHLGPVLEGAGGIVAAVDAARAGLPLFAAEQRRRFAATFDLDDPATSSQRAAEAIAAYLDRSVTSGGGEGPSRSRPLAHVATVLALIAAGWLAHAGLSPMASPAPGSPSFLAAAIDSHRTALGRKSAAQPSRFADTQAVARVSKIRLPVLPAEWTMRDVQIGSSRDGVVVQISIDAGGGRLLTFVATRADTPARGRPVVVRQGGRDVAFWDDGVFAYALVGDVDAAELDRFARGLSAELDTSAGLATLPEFTPF